MKFSVWLVCVCNITLIKHYWMRICSELRSQTDKSPWIKPSKINFALIFIPMTRSCGICKIMTWSDHCYMNKINAYFTRFGLSAHDLFVKWTPGLRCQICPPWVAGGKSVLLSTHNMEAWHAAVTQMQVQIRGSWAIFLWNVLKLQGYCGLSATFHMIRCWDSKI